MAETVMSGGEGLPEAAREALLRLPAELDRTWNARDARSFAALFAETGTFRLQGGEWIEGREAIERFWRDQVFAAVPSIMRHAISIERVRLVSEDVAVGDGTLRLVIPMGGRERVHTEAAGTLVAVRRGDAWLITDIRLAELRAAATST